MARGAIAAGPQGHDDTVAGLHLTAENLAGRRNKLGTVLIERCFVDQCALIEHGELIVRRPSCRQGPQFASVRLLNTRPRAIFFDRLS